MATIVMANRHTDVPERTARKLETRGHSVTVVPSKMQALELLRASLPDVLVIGDFLSDGYGVELFDALREMPGAGATKVVFLTVIGPDGDLMIPSRAFDACVLLSCGPWQILLTVESMLGCRNW
ncbi:MAG TPA: hypothetical protein VGM37_09810 [Armatimonadota bacterium]